ncbi:MAG TPA: hypothetical protein VLZ11_09320 [Flavobacterium sp.]|nr:hypothetical protein [Flavobacterium sp.]
MKRLLIALFFVSMYATAQKPCVYDYEISNDSTYYKETQKILIYESEFGKKSNYAFISLVNDSGYPMLNIQRVQKSDSFIETECLDKDSRIFLQLTNGRIYTLAHLDQEVCSARYPDMGNNLNIRVLNTSFFFMKDDLEDLKKYPVSILRIRYGLGDQTTYVMEKELVSKNLNTNSNPATIFMDYYKCIE